MSPSLVYYNWLIVRTLRRNIAQSPFEIRQSFKCFGANVALVDQEWLQLGVVLFCQRKESIQQILLTTVSTSLVVMMTSRNWPKDTKDTKVSNCWALKIYSEWAKACREHTDESNLTEMSLLTDNRDVLCEELCKLVVEIRKTDETVSTAWHPANFVWTAAIHQTGVAKNASYLHKPLPPTPQPSPETEPIQELRCIDINVLFAFESFRLVSLMIHV